MPDVKFKTKEEIPAEFHPFVEQKDGMFVVNLQPNAKVVEFRDKNIELMRERDGLKTKIETYVSLVGEDVDGFKVELAELRATAQKVKDGTLKGSNVIEEQVQERLKTSKAAWETERTQLIQKATDADAKAKATDAKLRRMQLHQAVSAAALHKDSPINPAALPDVLSRAESFGWQVKDDGTPVAMKGEAPVYSKKNAGDVMGLNEWLADVVAEAPYLGKSSTGGGAAGGRNAGQQDGFASQAFLSMDPATRITKYREAQAKS